MLQYLWIIEMAATFLFVSTYGSVALFREWKRNGLKAGLDNVNQVVLD
jgi:hypothetical protein